MPPTAMTMSATYGEKMTRAFDAQVEDVKRSTRTVVARICTEDIDRFNSIFSVRGAKIDNYTRNGVVLWEHGKDSRRMRDPIGKNEWIRKDGGQHPKEIIAKTRFLEDDFSNQRYEWYRDGVLSAFSIGAVPNLDRCGPATPEEIRANPELGRGQYIEFGGGKGVFMFREWELTEYSGTSVPGQANALTFERATKLLDCTKDGLWLPDDVMVICRAMTDSCGGQSGGGATLKPSEGKRQAKQIGDKWHAVDEDGESKGEYDDEESAKKHWDHKGSHSAPVIIEDNGVFWLDEGDRRTVSFPERSLAEECLALMRDAPSIPIDLMLMHSVGEIIRTRQEIKQEAEDWVNLYTRGHCGSAK